VALSVTEFTAHPLVTIAATEAEDTVQDHYNTVLRRQVEKG
jgi:hypothetical protein